MTLESLTRDVSLALRRLIRTPGFTLIAVLSLSLGIGVNTLMFSFMNAVLLQPLPYPDAARLVMVTMTHAGQSRQLRPAYAADVLHAAGSRASPSTRSASMTSARQVNLTR